MANIKDPFKSPQSTCVDENLCPEKGGCLRSGAVHGEGEDMAYLLVALLYTDPPSLDKISPEQG